MNDQNETAQLRFLEETATNIEGFLKNMRIPY